MSTKIQKSEIKNIPRGPFIVAGVLLIIIIILGGSLLTYQKAYAGKIYRGVSVAGLDLGGKTETEANQLLQNTIDAINRNGITVTAGDQRTTINPHIISPTDADLSYNLIDFRLDATLRPALQWGRQGNFLQNTVAQMRSAFAKKNFDPEYTLLEDQLIPILRENFKDSENPGHNASLIITKEGDSYTTTVSAEKVGQSFDYPSALRQLNISLQTLTSPQITLALTDDIPQIKQAQAQSVAPHVSLALKKPPLTLTNEDQTWTLDTETLAGLLDVVLMDERAALGLNAERFTQYLRSAISPSVEQEAADAKFSMVNGRVTEFQGAQNGRAIILDELLNTLNREYINGEKTTIAIPITITEPTVLTGEVNDLGITELLGVGLSDFAGSPPNRRHNIKVGADSLNGILIKPGEEFSLLKALGEIDGAHGYLPELVIKGNKTVPEFGGGLCQIGTTIFRATLASGLPITARQSHSYRVRYYEPAGIDATIYDPAPDFRFVNDTGHTILIQTKIIGNTLRFEFWGTQDGRRTHFIGQQESDDLYDITPKIWGFVSPPETKMVESLDIPVGAKKCTESAHVGATTEFTYQIFYPDGKQTEKIFKSVYKPWQAICLIGVDKLTAPEVNTDLNTDDTDNTDATVTNINTPAEQTINTNSN
ncbi:VanW family protein [Candidatus Falkowbacteria bacterium]|nr:VanW family protein [Candidatus Falkowbacteria bacterium]